MSDKSYELEERERLYLYCLRAMKASIDGTDEDVRVAMRGPILSGDILEAKWGTPSAEFMGEVNKFLREVQMSHDSTKIVLV